YADEARFDRLAPGRGELPLVELLEALPADGMLGLEEPMLEQALAGVSAQVRLADCIAQTRGLLDTVKTRRDAGISGATITASGRTWRGAVAVSSARLALSRAPAPALAGSGATLTE